MSGKNTEAMPPKDSSCEKQLPPVPSGDDSITYENGSSFDDRSSYGRSSFDDRSSYDDRSPYDYEDEIYNGSQYHNLKRKLEDLEDKVNKLKRNQKKKKKPTEFVLGYKENVHWELPYAETMADQIGPNLQLKKRSYEIRTRTSGCSTDCSTLKINAKLKENGTNNSDKEFRFPPTITVSLKNPENNSGIKKDYIRVWDLGFGSPITGSIYRHVFPQEIVEAAVNKERKIEISLCVSQTRARSTDGSLRWPMGGYALNTTLIKDGFLRYVEGPSFYTSSRGYRVKIKMVLGKTVRAIVQFVAGEFDHELPKSFCHLTTVSVFNRWDCLSTHITESAINDLAKTNSYQIELATHEKLDKEGFLIDDTLHLLVHITEVSF